MKMTPEQKAFYEYGEAAANLSFPRDFLRLNPPRLKIYEDILSRAEEECRGWLPTAERDCPNCKHHDLLTKQYPCRECYLHDDQRLWEPRKEAGND